MSLIYVYWQSGMIREATRPVVEGDVQKVIESKITNTDDGILPLFQPPYDIFAKKVESLKEGESVYLYTTTNRRHLLYARKEAEYEIR